MAVGNCNCYTVTIECAKFEKKKNVFVIFVLHANLSPLSSSQYYYNLIEV